GRAAPGAAAAAGRAPGGVLPGRALSPGPPPARRRRRGVRGAPFPPILPQPGRVPRRILLHIPAAFLVRRGGERERQPANVLDQVTERVRRARRGLAELVVLDARDQVGQSLGRWPEIHFAHDE